MCLHNLLRHAFSRLRHFHCLSQSHYRISYILLVSILFLLHTFLFTMSFLRSSNLGSKSYADISQLYNTYSFLIQSGFLLFLTNLSDIVVRLTALFFHSPYPASWKNILLVTFPTYCSSNRANLKANSSTLLYLWNLHLSYSALV